MDEENTKVAKKWTELIQLWLDTDMAPDNLTAQIWKGCPNQFRTQAWPLMLKIKKMEMLQEHQYGPNVYEVSLLKNCCNFKYVWGQELLNLTYWNLNILLHFVGNRGIRSSSSVVYI